jgi:mannose-6-phosphate isomerase-like protein (cupin superfamily)
VIRCVVTGQRADGKSVFVSDGVRESLRLAVMPPGWEFLRLWGADEPPRLPNDGTAPPQPEVHPPPGGYRFVFSTLPAASAQPPVPEDADEALAEWEAALPKMKDLIEPDHPGFHTTDTVDLNIVMSGEVWLELDDGEEVHLHTGDVVIQNGTRHAWHNRTEEPCRLFSAIIGATRDK